MKKFLIIFVVTFLLSALSLSAQYDLPNIISAKRVTDQECLMDVQINKQSDYILGKQKFNYENSLSMVPRNDSTSLWDKSLKSSPVVNQIIDMDSENAFLMSNSDTIYKFDYDGNILKQISVSSERTRLFKGNGKYIAVDCQSVSGVSRLFILNQELELEKIMSTDCERIINVSYVDNFFYISSDRYGGGDSSNMSSDITKLDNNGNVIWNYHLPDMVRPYVINNGNNIFFAVTRSRRTFPSVVWFYGCINPGNGDTLWTKEYRGSSAPAGCNVTSWVCGLIACGDGIVIAGSSTNTTQPLPTYDPNNYWPTMMFVGPDGYKRWSAAIAGKGSFETGVVNAKTELMLFCNYDSKGYIYLFNVPGVTAVEKVDSDAPNNFNLEQNYPNPFNPTTTIKFSISSTSSVSLKIYDLLGKEVVSLVDEELSAGSYSVNFNASNLSSGTYFYRLSTNNFNKTKKMVLLK